TTLRCRRVRRARRPASSRPTCSRRSAQATIWRTRRSASVSAASRRRKKSITSPTSWRRSSPGCATCHRSTNSPKKASICPRCSGRQKDTETMAYSNKVIDHYEHPRNVGSLPKDDVNVGTGLVGAPECGDVMKLQVKVNPATGVIDDAKFKTFGCGSAIASSSLATEWLKGKTVDEALAIKNTDIVNELSLPPVKIHCSVLAEDAIKAAIADYKKKQSAESKTAESVAQPTAQS